GVEDNLAHRLRATATDGRREHGAIHRGFQSDRLGPPAPHPDYPVGIRLPALPEKAGGTLALGREYWGIFERRVRVWLLIRGVRSVNEEHSGAGGCASCPEPTSETKFV